MMTEGELRSWGHGLLWKQLPRGWAPELSEKILNGGRKSSHSLSWVTSIESSICNHPESAPRETKWTSNYSQLQENITSYIRMTTSEAKNMPALSHRNEKQMSSLHMRVFLSSESLPQCHLCHQERWQAERQHILRLPTCECECAG